MCKELAPIVHKVGIQHVESDFSLGFQVHHCARLRQTGERDGGPADHGAATSQTEGRPLPHHNVEFLVAIHAIEFERLVPGRRSLSPVQRSPRVPLAHTLLIPQSQGHCGVARAEERHGQAGRLPQKHGEDAGVAVGHEAALQRGPQVAELREVDPSTAVGVVAAAAV